MTNASGRRAHAAIEYRDPKGRIWQASEIAQIRVVAPAIDGPNVCLVIRFDHEGEQRFAHWIGGEGWRVQRVLERLFAEARSEDTGVGPARPRRCRCGARRCDRWGRTSSRTSSAAPSRSETARR